LPEPGDDGERGQRLILRKQVAAGLTGPALQGAD
jgi:hypothetical protein